MTSLGKQIERAQIGLNFIDLPDELRVFSAGLSGDHSYPAVSLVRNNRDRPVRNGDFIILAQPFKKQMDQLVCGDAFFPHGPIIAETAGFANSRDAQ